MKFHNKRVLKHTNVLARDISTDKMLAYYHRCMENIRFLSTKHFVLTIRFRNILL